MNDLHGLSYDVVSTKRMTAQRPSPEGSIATVSLSFFLVTRALSQKSRKISLTSLCHIAIKVEAHKGQTDLTQCCNCKRFGHILVQCKQLPMCIWCRDGHCHQEPPEKGNGTSNCESQYPSGCRGCSSARKDFQRKKLHNADLRQPLVAVAPHK